jgi:hypothetical protein
MRKINLLLLGILSWAMISCEQLQELGLSEDEIVKGLKTALQVGADSSVTITSAVDGYYEDELIKILLPSEANVIVDNIKYVDQLADYLPVLDIDLQETLNKTILSMNRAAESAAKQATPIFADAITNLSITDGLSILNGENPMGGTKSASVFDSIAATHYLISMTRDPLVTIYKTPIDAELDKKLVGDYSTNELWTSLTDNYNILANAAQTVLSLDYLNLIPSDDKAMLQKFIPITETSLGQYVTGKALDGLFLKVSDQERSIRRDPWKWVSDVAGDVGDILQKVFGGE